MRVRGELHIVVVSGKNLADNDMTLVSWDLSDVKVEVFISERQIMSTRVINNSRNPQWDESSIIPLCHEDDYLEFKVWDGDYFGCTLVGKATVSLHPLTLSWSRDELILLDNNAGALETKLSFIPFNSPYITNVSPEPLGLRKMYYEPHIGGEVTLFQDAHNLNDDNGLFSSIAKTIQNSENFIYIVGWSMWTELQLVRHLDGKEETLGELLKKKANDGVRVLILIWDEKFSSRLCAGLIGTHDQQTIDYFQDSNVIAASVLRQRSNACPVEEQILETLYSHHMKLLISDTPKNGLVAYLGGLDLTDGRWDTPDHHLWSTLKTFHNSDFHNGYFTSVSEEIGPREPWHDTHSCVTGTIVWDLLGTFEERWRFQVPQHANKLLSQKEILKNKDSDENANKPKLISWHTQVLRSIDSDSVKFDKSKMKSLNCRRGHRIDTSIHRGLVALIRSTKKFIYIESQYFIGSSYAWVKETDVDADNLIPIEIAEQVVWGIKNGVGIRVYLVLPLAPEGDPTAGVVTKASMSAILHWQFLSIQMMYQRIAKALKEMSSSDHPSDYLLVLCLGQRRSKGRVARSVPMVEIDEDSIEFQLQQRRRFPVYVHSKMILADDSRIILGSANFNQRSIDGGRDSELNIAASQAMQVMTDSGPVDEVVSDGAISEFRKSLWKEHTEGDSETDPDLHDPGSKTCLTKLRDLAEDAFKKYSEDDFTEGIQCRFLRYPYNIESNGTLGSVPGMELLPDLGIPAVGEKAKVIPHIATT